LQLGRKESATKQFSLWLLGAHFDLQRAGAIAFSSRWFLCKPETIHD